jgi:hypothetical protein
MRPNRHYSKNENTSHAKVLTNKKITAALMLFSLLSIGLVLVATQLHAA